MKWALCDSGGASSLGFSPLSGVWGQGPQRPPAGSPPHWRPASSVCPRQHRGTLGRPSWGASEHHCPGCGEARWARLLPPPRNLRPPTVPAASTSIRTRPSSVCPVTTARCTFLLLKIRRGTSSLGRPERGRCAGSGRGVGAVRPFARVSEVSADPPVLGSNSVASPLGGGVRGDPGASPMAELAPELRRRLCAAFRAFGGGRSPFWFGSFRGLL